MTKSHKRRRALNYSDGYESALCGRLDDEKFGHPKFGEAYFDGFMAGTLQLRRRIEDVENDADTD